MRKINILSFTCTTFFLTSLGFKVVQVYESSHIDDARFVENKIQRKLLDLGHMDCFVVLGTVKSIEINKIYQEYIEYFLPIVIRLSV